MIDSVIILIFVTSIFAVVIVLVSKDRDALSLRVTEIGEELAIADTRAHRIQGDLDDLVSIVGSCSQCGEPLEIERVICGDCSCTCTPDCGLTCKGECGCKPCSTGFSEGRPTDYF